MNRLRKKIILIFLTCYVLFIGFLYLYLFNWNTGALSADEIGTAVDPATFLTGEELVLSEQYSNIRNLLFFLGIPYEWLFYLLILLLGIGKVFEKWAESTSKRWLFKSAIFTFCLSFASFLFFFPLGFVGYRLSKSYGLSNETFHGWMRDQLIDFWIKWVFLFIIVTFLYWLIRKSEKRWWLYAWFLSIPFTVFMMFIQPVIIDPLYNDFYPLKDKALEDKILSLAAKADIPAEHVYEVNMSEKTNTLNAYVTGIGSNSRIVLWDTTLTKLDDEEILFIMAHEMAHYVEKHIYFGIAGTLLLLLAGLFITAKLLDVLCDKYGEILRISDKTNLSSLPLILLILSVLSFAASPISNAVSRYQEERADRYAIEMTRDVDAGISTFHELTRAGLSQVNPPKLVKWFRYGHPTMKERIEMIETYEQNK